MNLLAIAYTQTPYQAALIYQSLGISILPCRGKEPAVGAWKRFSAEPANATIIQMWERAGLLQNIGVICGPVSRNLVVIDLDGEKAVAAFRQRWPHLTDTYTVQSGSGVGQHLYLTCDLMPMTTRVVGTDMGNIELRAGGCYVVAPPSIHPSGRPYKIVNAVGVKPVTDLADVVAWIKRLIADKHGGVMPPAANAGEKRPVRAGSRYGQVALADECDKVARAASGQRNQQVFISALKLARLVATGHLSDTEVERALMAAAAGLSADDGEMATLRTIRSGLERGRTPREVKS